jgi:hypothetical protein
MTMEETFAFLANGGSALRGTRQSGMLPEEANRGGCGASHTLAMTPLWDYSDL